MTANQAITPDRASWLFTGLLPHAYRVILVDAPTKFSSGPNRNPVNHYKTMTIAEIATLPVGELAHPDGCRLVMWITWPQLHRVPELLSAWGFRYCTGRPWLKTWPKEDGLILYPNSFAVGCGYEVRNTSELQIIAKRGRPSEHARSASSITWSRTRPGASTP